MNPAPFVVHAFEGRVDGWTTLPLPYGPKGPMLEDRQALRDALGHMAPGLGADAGGGVRQCRCATLRRQNLLVYNVGVSEFAHLNVD